MFNLVFYYYDCLARDFTTPKQSQTVDLKKDFTSYSFLASYPEEEATINKLFEKTIQYKGKSVSVESLLQASACGEKDLKLFKKMEFEQLNSNPQRGLTLEHPDFKGWLIKKNYGFQSEKKIMKTVSGSGFPSWMLPEGKKVQENDRIAIQVPSDRVHPLRVPMLMKGKKWIEYLKLRNIQTAEEFLYPLRTADPKKPLPLHQRVVVISKKVDILSESDHLNRFVQMANESPEQLRDIANQMVLLIKHWQLTDAHLLNFRFLNDQTNTLMVLDGEPIGGLADVSEKDAEGVILVEGIQRLNPGLYSLLGLKKLQASIFEAMRGAKIRISPSDIQKVQNIFDEEINRAIDDVIKEKRYQWIKIELCATSSLCNFVIACLDTPYCLLSDFLPFNEEKTNTSSALPPTDRALPETSEG